MGEPALQGAGYPDTIAACRDTEHLGPDNEDHDCLRRVCGLCRSCLGHRLVCPDCVELRRDVQVFGLKRFVGIHLTEVSLTLTMILLFKSSGLGSDDIFT